MDRYRGSAIALWVGMIVFLGAGLNPEVGLADSSGGSQGIQLQKVPSEQARRLAEQERLLREEQKKLSKELAKQKRQIQKLEALLNAIANQKNEVRRADLANMRATGEGGPVAQANSAPRIGEAPKPVTRAPEVAPLTQPIGLLTPRGKFVFEPSLQYSHSSNSRVELLGFTVIPALTIGLIDVQNVNRDQFIAAVTGRYGITNRFEVEAKIPWVYEADSTLERPFNVGSSESSVFDNSGSGLGDIEFTGRYQLTEQAPFYIGWLRFKTHTGTGPFQVSTTTPLPGLIVQNRLPTGTGFYTLQPGITALVPSDPAVFFGGLSYIWNIKRHVNSADINGVPTSGEYNPGNGVNFNFGMGLGINDRASFSVGYDHTTFFKDQFNGQVVPNAQTTQLGELLFGVAYRLNARKTFNVTLGAGLTPEAPNVQITLRLPMTF